MSDNKEFPKKYAKQLPSGFEEMAQGMKTEEIKKAIYEYEANLYTIEQAKEEDTQLQTAKETVKDMAGPYNDAKKAQTAKIKYALFVLENRGVDLEKGNN